MCTAWSGILRHDFTWVPKRSPHIHSHSRQARDAGLPERSGTESYVKVEVCPGNNDYTSDPMAWTVIIDEHRRPKWVTEEWPRVEDSARRQASAWARAHIVRDNGGIVYVGRDKTIIVVGSPARIDVADGGWCDTHDTSAPGVIDVADGGRCCVRDSSAPGRIDVAGGGNVDWRSSVPSEGRIFRAPPTTTGA